MTTNVNHDHHDHEHATESKVVFGFWVYIMTDLIMFSAIFATYVVLHNSTYGSIGIGQVAPLHAILIQTIVLLAATFTYSLALVAVHKANKCQVRLWLIISFLLGLGFVALEQHQFAALIHNGYTWQTSAFLSAYFSLLGIHWIHVIVALIWIAVLLIQIAGQGLTATMRTRLTCLGLFWNFISIVWIFIFVIVYLMGAI